MEYTLKDTRIEDCRLYGSGSTEEYVNFFQKLAVQQCVVKSVGNGDWCALIEKCKDGKTKTPATLMPPAGRNMRLYGLWGLKFKKNIDEPTTSCRF
jgi:hypothetical protein